MLLRSVLLFYFTFVRLFATRLIDELFNNLYIICSSTILIIVIIIIIYTYYYLHQIQIIIVIIIFIIVILFLYLLLLTSNTNYYYCYYYYYTFYYYYYTYTYTYYYYYTYYSFIHFLFHTVIPLLSQLITDVDFSSRERASKALAIAAADAFGIQSMLNQGENKNNS